MSANRWSECPNCTKKRVDVLAEVRKLYGTIPLEEFEKRLRAANISEDEEPDPTMREDGFELKIKEKYKFE